MGLGVVAMVGAYSGLTSLQQRQKSAEMSEFLSEIMIAALPMAWIDGELTDNERDTIDRFMVTSGIIEKDRNSIWKSIEKQQTFDQIMKASILFDDEHREKNCNQSKSEQIKHRLILCMAWEIAIADDKIYPSELYLHNRMADKLGISHEEVKEIRRVITLKHDRDLQQFTEILNNDSKVNVFSVREQYLLQPGSDNL